MRFLRTLTFLCILGVTFNSQAQDSIGDENTIHLVTPLWDGWTNEDGTGFYFELINLVYEPNHINSQFQVSPFARSIRLVQSKKADAMFSVYKRKDTADILTSKFPIDAGTVLVMFDKKREWNGLLSLQDQAVIMPRAYKYDENIPYHFVLMEVNNSTQGMKMFLRGRAPFFITHYEEMLQLQDKMTIDIDKYRTEVAFRKDLYMGFANTEKGKRLRNIFDQEMPHLIASGKIRALYEKWELEQFVNFKSDLTSTE